MVARAVLLQMFQSGNRLLDTRPMARGHPPHHEIWSLEVLEPLGAAAIEALVNCLIDEALKRLDILPDGQIDGDARVGVRSRAGGVAAVVDIAPDEARR